MLTKPAGCAVQLLGAVLLVPGLLILPGALAGDWGLTVTGAAMVAAGAWMLKVGREPAVRARRGD